MMLAAFLIAALAVIDPSLQPPADAALVASTQGGGVQVYGCGATANGDLAWTLIEPEAYLYANDGTMFGAHGKGPSWTAADGSKIVADGATPLARVVHAGSIPELLLRVSEKTGSGVLSNVRFVQRTDTVGGAAPPNEECDAATTGARRAIRYGATYRFFR